MTITRLGLLCLFSLLAATPLGCGVPSQPIPEPDEGPVEWSKPYAGYLPGMDEDTRSVVLVRDARTRRPIPGAVVTRHLEMDMGPEGWAPELERAVTDEFGLAWIRLPEEDAEARYSAHYAVRAEGYAPTEEYGALIEEVIELTVGRDLHGRVEDALGRAAAHLAVEYKVGCGHAPALRKATTDADGVFVLRNVEPLGGEATFFGPGIVASYFSVAEMRPTDESPPTYVAEPGVRIEGRILGVDPAALDPGIVHARSTQRGSLARVAEDGTFVLEGCEAGGQLALYGMAEGDATWLNTYDRRPDGPLLWNPHEVWPDGSPKEEPREVAVSVQAVDDRTGDPVRPVTIYFDREPDNLRIDARLDEDEPQQESFDVPPGTYRVSAGDPTAQWAADDVRVQVDAESPAPLVVRVRRQARAVVQWETEPPGEFQLHVCLADERGRILENDSRLEDWLPHEGRAVLQVKAHGLVRHAPFGPSDGTRRIARPAWPAPTRVRLKSSLKGCRFHLGGTEIEPQATEQGLTFETWLQGRLRLAVTHTDGRHVSRLVDLPAPGGGGIDVGSLELPPERKGTLTVLDAQGHPAAKRWIEITYVDARGHEHETRERCLTDETGRLTNSLLRAAAVVMLQDADAHTWDPHDPLTGPGPYELRLGGAAVEVTARSEQGDPVDGVVLYLDGVLFEPKEDAPGPLRIQGLEEGPHTLIVAASGRLGEVHRLVLGAHETRHLEIVLPKRR